MRMRAKVRLKQLYYILVLSCIFFLITMYTEKSSNKWNQIYVKGGRKVASINIEELEYHRRQRQDNNYQPTSLHKPKLSLVSPKTTTTLSDKSQIITNSANPVLFVPNPCVRGSLNCTDFNMGARTLNYSAKSSTKAIPKKSNHEEHSEFNNLPIQSNNILALNRNSNFNIQPLDGNLLKKNSHVNVTFLKKMGIDPKNVMSYLLVFQDIPKVEAKKCDNCNRVLTIRRRGGYSSRNLIENVSLPTSWQPSEELSKRLTQRKEHVKQVCQRRHLDQRNPSNQPNSWEFLINQKYGLIWCNVFKAASSTWFYNFNILAGYSETALLNAKDTPISLARKKYPRPSVEQLDKALNSSGFMSFMIARHPLERLVSAYRNKLESGNRYYRNLVKKIMSLYPKLGPTKPIEFLTKELRKKDPKRPLVKTVAPSFQQFVQFIIDSYDKGVALDEHWVPMTKFCTPCLVDFDVYVKVENLDDEGNYIIFKSGIKDVIHPKRINRSKNEPTNVVADSFLCQLTKTQMEGLIRIYETDMELFQYDYEKYKNCTKPE